MPRRPATFTQADVARVLRAVRDAGVRARVHLNRDGSIDVLPAEEAPPPEPRIDDRPPKVMI
jgi:hypothetical protein